MRARVCFDTHLKPWQVMSELGLSSHHRAGHKGGRGERGVSHSPELLRPDWTLSGRITWSRQKASVAANAELLTNLTNLTPDETSFAKRAQPVAHDDGGCFRAFPSHDLMLARSRW
jgi:hypothetical protein